MPYELRERAPTASELAALREAAGMAPRSLEALRRGLPNSVYAVVAVHEPASDEPAASLEQRGRVVGTARIVGDDGAVYHLSDMVVHPDHQGRGLGTRLMDELMAYVAETAPPRAYVTLLADVDGFYERWGFRRTAPASNGMYLRTGGAEER